MSERSGLIMKYFVLKPKGCDIYAIASRAAMRAYAAHIRKENNELAKELYGWADRESSRTMYCTRCGKRTSGTVFCDGCGNQHAKATSEKEGGDENTN